MLACLLLLACIGLALRWIPPGAPKYYMSQSSSSLDRFQLVSVRHQDSHSIRYLVVLSGSHTYSMSDSAQTSPAVPGTLSLGYDGVMRAGNWLTSGENGEVLVVQQDGTVVSVRLNSSDLIALAVPDDRMPKTEVWQVHILPHL